MTDFSTLLGKTITKIVVADDNSTVDFLTSDGVQYHMYHCQDCCESVYLEDVVGDLEDLLNTPITVAEVSTEDCPDGEWGDISGWTFYKLATVKGYVDLRWLGSSNGYYSIDVSFAQAYPIPPHSYFYGGRPASIAD